MRRLDLGGTVLREGIERERLEGEGAAGLTGNGYRLLPEPKGSPI